MKTIGIILTVFLIQACASSATSQQARSSRANVKFDHAKYCAGVVPPQVLHRYYYAKGYGVNGVQINRGSGVYRGTKHACYGGTVHDSSQNCPSLANPFCLVNWTSLDTGIDESEVKILLGAPTSISGKTWSYNNIGKVTFDLESKKVAGYSKPIDENYWFLGPITDVANREPVTLLASACPPNGFAACKFNWDQIRQGVDKTDVERLIGPADGIEIAGIVGSAGGLDEKWIYPNSGVVRILNGTVISYSKPSGFRYLGATEK